MRFRRLIFAAAFNFLFLAVCAVVAKAQQAESERFDVRGQVINSGTGEPVGGALVRIFDAVRFSEPDGTFVFTGLPRGRSNVFARKPGYFNPQQLAAWMAGGDPVVDVPTDAPVVVKLTPEGIIYGEVKNAEGEPMDGVSVKAQRWRIDEGRKRLQVEKETRTDDEGKFRIAELVPGKYYLSFQPANDGWRTFNELSKKRRREEGYGPQFFPGVADAAAATAFEVRGGAQVHVTHNLLRQRLFEVSGVVRGANGQPFNLTLDSSTGGPVQHNIRLNSQTGEFQIPGIPAGVYMLTAIMPRQRMQNSPDPDPGPLSAMLPVHVTGDLSGVVLALGSGISVGVQVREELTNAGSEPHHVFVRMIPKEFEQSGSGITVPPLPGNPGPTRLENLSPGVYSVDATAQQGPQDYVAALRCGNLDLLRDDLVIAPGAAPPPIEVTLRDDGAQLTLALKDNDKPAGIVVYSQDYPRRSLLLPFASPNASISLSNLPPGAYAVAAVTDAADLEYRNPAAMEKYLSHATSVTLQPRDRAEITVPVQQLAEQPQ